jgi:hypothetical protein
MSAAVFSRLKQLIRDEVPKGDRQLEALDRIGVLNPDTPLDGEVEMAQSWTNLEKSALDNDAFEKGVATVWTDVGCDKDRDAHYRIESIVDSFGEGTEKRNTLAIAACAFLDEAHCPGARGLPDATKDKLRQVPDHAQGACTKGATDPSR